MKRKGEGFLAKGTTLQIERHIWDEGSWHDVTSTGVWEDMGQIVWDEGRTHHVKECGVGQGSLFS